MYNVSTEDDNDTVEAPSKYRRLYSTESLLDDLDLFSWLNSIF